MGTIKNMDKSLALKLVNADIEELTTRENQVLKKIQGLIEILEDSENNDINGVCDFLGEYTNCVKIKEIVQ